MLSISERQFSAYWIASLQPEQRQAIVAELSPEQLKELLAWRRRARDEQLPPPGDWRTWLFLAGRGAGKTRSGAEWIHEQIQAGRKRIALVAPTAADARDVMVEGESGILAVSADEKNRPIYEPSKRRLTWPNGAIATTYSADEPERLRGPQHDCAWCDEMGAWRYPEAWDMLMFGLRLGTDPRVMVTTTPRPTRLLRNLIADPTTVITRGSTYENRANLAGAFLERDGQHTRPLAHLKIEGIEYRRPQQTVFVVGAVNHGIDIVENQAAEPEFAQLHGCALHLAAPLRIGVVIGELCRIEAELARVGHCEKDRRRARVQEEPETLAIGEGFDVTLIIEIGLDDNLPTMRRLAHDWRVRLSRSMLLFVLRPLIIARLLLALQLPAKSHAAEDAKGNVTGLQIPTKSPADSEMMSPTIPI